MSMQGKIVSYRLINFQSNHVLPSAADVLFSFYRLGPKSH
jgi:hypothetical protein